VQLQYIHYLISSVADSYIYHQKFSNLPVLTGNTASFCISFFAITASLCYFRFATDWNSRKKYYNFTIQLLLDTLNSFCVTVKCDVLLTTLSREVITH